MLKKYLIVFLISMVPLVELRGAIPVGVAYGMTNGIPLLLLYIVSILGNMLPVPFIYLFARKVLVWGLTKKYTNCEREFEYCYPVTMNRGEN